MLIGNTKESKSKYGSTGVKVTIAKSLLCGILFSSGVGNCDTYGGHLKFVLCDLSTMLKVRLVGLLISLKQRNKSFKML